MDMLKTVEEMLRDRVQVVFLRTGEPLPLVINEPPVDPDDTQPLPGKFTPRVTLADVVNVVEDSDNGQP